MVDSLERLPSIGLANFFALIIFRLPILFTLISVLLGHFFRPNGVDTRNIKVQVCTSFTYVFVKHQFRMPNHTATKSNPPNQDYHAVENVLYKTNWCHACGDMFMLTTRQIGVCKNYAEILCTWPHIEKWCRLVQQACRRFENMTQEHLGFWFFAIQRLFRQPPGNSSNRSLILWESRDKKQKGDHECPFTGVLSASSPCVLRWLLTMFSLNGCALTMQLKGLPTHRIRCSGLGFRRGARTIDLFISHAKKTWSSMF